jgi:hypothetical protein
MLSISPSFLGGISCFSSTFWDLLLLLLLSSSQSSSSLNVNYDFGHSYSFFRRLMAFGFDSFLTSTSGSSLIAVRLIGLCLLGSEIRI